MQRLEASRHWRGETSRITLSVHFSSIILDLAPLRSPGLVRYVHPAYLVLGLLIKCMLSVIFYEAYISLQP